MSARNESAAIDPDDPTDEPGEMGHDGTTNERAAVRHSIVVSGYDFDAAGDALARLSGDLLSNVAPVQPWPKRVAA